MRNKLWLTVIITGWAAVVSASSILDLRRDLAPASDWLTVRAVHVYDTWEGEAPFLSVDRTIHAPFHGQWTATVRTVSDGTNASVCIAEGRSPYAVDARLPPNLTLDWWTYPARCRMAPGRYRLDTLWRIHPPSHPEKMLFSTSNVFEVHARPAVRGHP